VNHYEKVSEGNKDEEDDDTSNAASSQDESCTISYCNCPCHKKKGPTPPPPQPAPPAIGGYWRFLCPKRILIPQAHKITAVALHHRVFEGITFFLREALW
jgi:hypothetical protein